MRQAAQCSGLLWARAHSDTPGSPATPTQRSPLERGVLGILLAVAVPAGAFGTASAQTEVWSATLTVGALTNGNGTTVAYGYRGDSQVGSLSADGFTLEGVDYTISLVVTFTNTPLIVRFDPTGGTVFHNGEFTLQVGTQSFSFVDASFSSRSGQFIWMNPGLSWAAGDTLSVSLLHESSQGPTLRSASTSPTGGEVHLDFDVAVDDSSLPRASAFNIEADGVQIPLPATNPISVAGNSVTVTLSRAIFQGQSVTISYTDPSTGDDTAVIQDSDGNDAASFNNEPVRNISNQPREPDPPTALSATAGDVGIITLHWSAPDYDGGSAIEGYEIKMSIDGGDTWAVLDADTRSTGTTYEDSSPSGTTRRYRVSAINSVGTSAPSNEAGATMVGGEISIAAVEEEVTEGEGAVFRLTRTGVTTVGLTANVSVTESGSMARRSMPSTVSFAPDSVSATLRVATDDDRVIEESSTFTARVTDGDAYTVATEAASATVTVADNDAATFSVAASPARIEEGHLSTFAVSVTNGATFAADQTIALSFAGSTASQETDFTVSDETLVLRAGSNSVTTTVTAVDDEETEPAETVTLTASRGGETIGSATTTIAASDPPVVSVVAVASPVYEGQKAEFRVSRTGPTAELLVVPVVVEITRGSGPVTMSMRLRPGDRSRVGYFMADVTLGSRTVTWTLQEGEGYSVSPEATSASVLIRKNDRAALTTSFSDMPASHTGERFTFGLTFSEAFPISYRTIRDHAFTVTGGRVTSAKRLDNPHHESQGLEPNREWRITVEPGSANDTVTIALPATTLCNASGAICTEDGRRLSNSQTATVAGTVVVPTVSVSNASASEGEAVEFTVSLASASGQQVTVQYATSNGTAESGTDFTAASSTLTFGANETSKTVSVATTDDSVDEDDETFTLTLSRPTNATLADATATGTINDDDDAALLVASFSDMPASHTGERFTFGLTFSEAFPISYRTIRDHAFTVTGGRVTSVKRVDNPHDERQGLEPNREWRITVEPGSANDTVTIALPATTLCNASGAICTEDGRRLSNSQTDKVDPAASSSAGDRSGRNPIADRDPMADVLALAGLTPDEAAAALFGEESLGEDRLAALDRLGNQNGSYDLGDVLSWIDRCRRGEADCGGSSTDSGPAGAGALPAAARGGGTSGRTGGRAPGPRRRSPRVRRARRRRGTAPQALAMLLAATMTWSCTDDAVGPVAAEPDPGFLTVELIAPAANRDIGVLLELEGPGIETVRAPGFELYESETTGPHQIVVAGSLRSGPMVQFEVPDRNQLDLYRVHVLMVTGEDYGLRDAREYRAAIRH